MKLDKNNQYSNQEFEIRRDEEEKEERRSPIVLWITKHKKAIGAMLAAVACGLTLVKCSVDQAEEENQKPKGDDKKDDSQVLVIDKKDDKDSKKDEEEKDNEEKEQEEVKDDENYGFGSTNKPQDKLTATIVQTVKPNNKPNTNKPSGTTKPVTPPEGPVNPDKPEEPEKPIAPIEPIKPIDPIKPTDPIKPVDPKPEEPKPEEPKPEQPKPEKPNRPGNSGNSGSSGNNRPDPKPEEPRPEEPKPEQPKPEQPEDPKPSDKEPDRDWEHGDQDQEGIGSGDLITFPDDESSQNTPEESTPKVEESSTSTDNSKNEVVERDHQHGDQDQESIGSGEIVSMPQTVEQETSVDTNSEVSRTEQLQDLYAMREIVVETSQGTTVFEYPVQEQSTSSKTYTLHL